jgi:hypothetical protein
MTVFDADDASDRGDLAPVPIPCGRQRVVVPEQLVCAVDQIDVHGKRQGIGA